MTTHEALRVMMQCTGNLASRIAQRGYTDSDYDVMENYLTVTNSLLAADYEDDTSLLPDPDEAPWCPDNIVQFLKEAHV